MTQPLVADLAAPRGPRTGRPRRQHVSQTPVAGPRHARAVAASRGGLVALVLAVACLAGASALVIVAWHQSTAAPSPLPAAGIDRPYYPEPEPGGDPVAEAAAAGGGPAAPAKARQVVPGQPLHLRIPAVGIDVNVGRMSVPPGGAVDPPTERSAYWLVGYGVAGPTSTNTAYIAAHTCRGAGCRAAFSPMLDIPTSTTRVHPGDQVVVTTPEGESTYTVTDTALYDKPSVPAQQEMWKAVPGRLVLVTCFQYAGGTSSQQNFVVYAQLDQQ